MNQHKNKYAAITVLIVCCGLLAGCKKDFLDRTPKDMYTDQTFWTTAKDVTAAINGCYQGWESADNILMNDCYSDNQLYANGFAFGGPASVSNYESFANGLMNPANTNPNFYNYKTIYNCNWFLENVDKVADNIVAPDIKKRMKAEARFLRAYRYFVLSQFYRDVPLVLRTMSAQESRLQKQVARAVIRDTIISELAKAAPDLPLNYNGFMGPGPDHGRITRGAALALKARVELFSGKYSDCIATSSQLMTAPFNYAIYPNYEGLFRPQFESNAQFDFMVGNNDEVILDVQYAMPDNFKATLSSIAINPVGASSVAITQSLVDEFETTDGKTIQNDPSYDPLQPYENRDKRLDATIIRPGLFYNGSYFDPITPPPPPPPGFPPGFGPPSNFKGAPGNSPTGYNLKKYLSNLNDYMNTPYGTTSLLRTGGNVIVIRYAEVLLTYAEAKIEAGQIDNSVYDAINQLRARAGLPNVSAATHPDQTSLRALVRRERRVELAGEGLRWFDIVRWQTGPQAISNVYDCLNGTVNPMNGTLTLVPNSSTAVRARQFTPKYYVFPFPPVELQANTNLQQQVEYR